MLRYMKLKMLEEKLNRVLVKLTTSHKSKKMPESILELPTGYDNPCPFYDEEKGTCNNEDSYCYKDNPKYKNCIVDKVYLGINEEACTSCGVIYRNTIGILENEDKLNSNK